MRLALLSYDDVVAGNAVSLREAAVARGVELVVWQPHRLALRVDGDGERLFHGDDEVAWVPYRRPRGGGRGVTVDAVVHRTVARFAGVVAPALGMLATAGAAVLNDFTSGWIGRDKLSTAILLARSGVPVVPTVACYADRGASGALLGSLDGAGSSHPPGVRELVWKPALGSQGRGGVLATSGLPTVPDEVREHDVAGSALLREHWIVQRYVAPPPGRAVSDLRAYVVDGSCVALARRVAAPGEWRANLALGARAEALALDHPAAALAVRACTVVGLDHAGVDLLEDADGSLLVNEVDGWAGFAGLEAATGADVAGAVVDLALARAAARTGRRARRAGGGAEAAP